MPDSDASKRSSRRADITTQETGANQIPTPRAELIRQDEDRRIGESEAYEANPATTVERMLCLLELLADCEAHLKGLIDREPERAFLWARLGNLYSHSGQKKRARTAYERAIELDPKDIEAHSMLGRLLIETDRPLEAVPHFHAVLKHVRDARQIDKNLRRNLVRRRSSVCLPLMPNPTDRSIFCP